MRYCPECGHTVAPVEQNVTGVGYVKYTVQTLRHDPAIHPEECQAVWQEETSSRGPEETAIRRIDQ